MTTPTDMLIFRGGIHDGGRALWDGSSWPPPQRLAVLWQGSRAQLGAILSDVDQLTPDVLAELASTTITVHYYRLRNCSQIDTPAKPDENWFRGAEYVPET